MNGNKGNVLIVDDDPNAIRVLSAILVEDGYRILESCDVEGAMEIIYKDEVDAVITELKMPGRDGMQFFEYIIENRSDIPVIFLTAHGTVESAVHAMAHGAFHYSIKPPDYLKLRDILAKAVNQHRSLYSESEFIRQKLDGKDYQQQIIGNSHEMLKKFDIIEKIKDTVISTLICGETGTGKELIAKALHFSSIRINRPFVAINCAAVPKELLEAELFGYEKGAFTGAVEKRIGKFEQASGGTVFLDEIGELGPFSQAKLLRVIQEKEIERLGSNKKIKVDFRLISSTNRDLREEGREGNFREDLFYRINVVQIDVPHLRDRRDDIPLLTAEFIKEFCERDKKALTLSDEVMGIFYNYPWPGNVRQLRNIIERAVVLSKGDRITLRELPEELLSFSRTVKSTCPVRTLREVTIQAIKDSLDQCNGNKSKAARMIGISRKAFYNRLREFPELCAVSWN